jgi:hypothetical protein|tara:strand:+ start:419 stop:667 length:249 start_codon:yes stop_codon:yes gene_type:complete
MKQKNTYDVICAALREAPNQQHPQQLAWILEKEGGTAGLHEREIHFICEQAIKMAGKKDFREKAKWILELTGDLHIVKTNSI